MQLPPFRKTNVLGTFLREWLFSSVWCPEIRFFPSRETHVSCVPRILLRYSLHLAVCKCGLCLLTGTGRYFDGNWMVCWRLLDYFWRKLDGLLMDTGRYNDGNWTFSWTKQEGLLAETGWSGNGKWMVYWRKLDGQLTETGRSNDGKSEVYCWKQSSRFSSFWAPENAILPSSETRGFVDT